MAYGMVWDRLILTGDKDDYSSSHVKLSAYGNGRCELPPLYKFGSVPSLTKSAVPNSQTTLEVQLVLNLQGRWAKAEVQAPALSQSGWSAPPFDLDRAPDTEQEKVKNLRKSEIYSRQKLVSNAMLLTLINFNLLWVWPHFLLFGLAPIHHCICCYCFNGFFPNLPSLLVTASGCKTLSHWSTSQQHSQYDCRIKAWRLLLKQGIYLMHFWYTLILCDQTSLLSCDLCSSNSSSVQIHIGKSIQGNCTHVDSLRVLLGL